MRRIFMVSGVFVIFLNIVISGVFADYNISNSDYFPLELGNQWVYKVNREQDGRFKDNILTSSISSIEVLDGTKTCVFDSPQDGVASWHMSIDDKGIYTDKIVTTRGITLVFSPPLFNTPSRLDQSFKEGVKNKTTVKYYNALGEQFDEGMITVETEFQDFEDITVAAGEFKNCIKTSITCLLETKDNEAVSQEFIWLAEGVGEVKRTKRQEAYETEDVEKGLKEFLEKDYGVKDIDAQQLHKVAQLINQTQWQWQEQETETAEEILSKKLEAEQINDIAGVEISKIVSDLAVMGKQGKMTFFTVTELQNAIVGGKKIGYEK